MLEDVTAVKEIERKFFLIVGAALISALIGGLFGAAISMLSPEFVADIFGKGTVGIIRYGSAVGAIWGVFLGAAVMTLIIAVSIIANSILRKKENEAK